MRVRLARADRGEVVAGLAGTALAHGLALAFVIAISLQHADPLGTVYAVNLVAAPAAPPEIKRATPEATPRPAPAERTAPIEPPKKTAKAIPVPARPTPQPRTEAAPQRATANRPMPGETPSTGTDVANVSTPGAEFPFPGYLQTIVNEIYRRWQRPAGSPALRTEITFLILRDGTVKEIRVATRSRSFSFDLGAQGAVEAAANARAFGPLPEGFPSDVLQISLWFVPRGTQ
ncbi:MAG: TonB protein [Gemmatimonadetes bacterium]|nr:TonB protein [Gemmatimonadota bacterium]